ncbi:6-phosphogluconolactonase [Gaertneriomyces sp. JEL0708]|nr:6-phosphogluconolactonase [Gaertneriomyces sp. JEL0708]
MTATEYFAFPTSLDISVALDRKVTELSKKAIETSSRFTVALSGGSLPKILGEKLKDNKDIDFSKWHIFWADERCVPLDSQDSNYLAAKETLLDHIKIPQNQIHTINPALIDNPSKAASDYVEQLHQVFGQGTPAFDLILLGMGPDGHCCSLFPGHKLLDFNDALIAPITDSPKPPPSRITFTYPLVNNATTNLFVVTGEGKADVLHRIIDLKEDFPSGRGA